MSITRRLALAVVGSVILASGAAVAIAQNKPEIWAYDYAQKIGVAEAFPLPSPPQKFLSGTLWFTAEQAVIVAGPGLADAENPEAKKEFGLGLVYAGYALNSLQEPPSEPAGLECSGKGDTAASALNIVAMPPEMDQVMAATLCAYARHKNDTWRSAQLIADDKHFYAVVEYRTPSDRLERVYVNIDTWSRAILAEL